MGLRLPSKKVSTLAVVALGILNVRSGPVPQR